MTDKPTSGRIVQYRPKTDQIAYFCPDGGGTVPAIVVGQNPAGGTNVRVLPNAGHGGALFLSNVVEGDKPGNWSWPKRAGAKPRKPKPDGA